MKRKTSQVASELIKRLDTHLNDESIGNPFFPERGIQPFPLTTDGFKTIQNVDSDKKTAFVDGGNQEVLGAPNFSVQLNRVYFGIWSGNKRVPERSIPKRIEFFAATFSDFERGEIQYSTSLFPLSGEEAIPPRERDLCFSSKDRSIAVGNQRAYSKTKKVVWNRKGNRGFKQCSATRRFGKTSIETFWVAGGVSRIVWGDAG
jgi:hypothetical protein